MFASRLPARLARAVVVGCGFALIATISVAPASAQTFDKKTVVTFSAPVEIPGPGIKILPAGSYTFRLLDSKSDRHIVQILNADETKLFATVLAIPNYRLKATDQTVMTFAERSAGQPQAIRAWFYPGETSGQEFAYPKSRAMALATVTQSPILYIPDTVASNIIADVKSANEESVTALRNARIAAIRANGEDVNLSDVVTQPPASNRALPKTASRLPALALLGTLCLGIGFSLRGLCARA